MDNFLIVIKSLADDTRLKIITLLLKHDFCVRALANKLNISEAAVSQHLQILKKAGLVKGEKRGYYTHYLVQREVIREAAKNLKDIASKEYNYNSD